MATNFRNRLTEFNVKVKNFFSQKTCKIIALSFGIFVVGVSLIFFYLSFSYQEKILPNIHVGKIDFGGLTKSAAKDKLSSSLKNTENQDLILSYQDRNWQKSYQDLEINYDIDKTIENIYLIGHTKSAWKNIKETVVTLFTDKTMPAIFTYDSSKVNDLFSLVMADLSIQTKDAILKEENGELVVEPEQTGKAVDAIGLKNNFYQTVESINYGKITVVVEVENPKISEDQLEKIKPQVTKIIDASIVLNSSEGNFEYNSKDIFSWLDIVANPTSVKEVGLISKAMAKDDNNFNPEVVINPEKIKIDIGEISQKINKEPMDAKLSISGGKAVISTPGQDGYNLDQDKTVESIIDTLSARLKVAGESTDSNSRVKTKLELPLTSVKPTVTNDTIDNLGIKELIGKGTTNFSGSTTNRITNIKVGSSIFNGALIKPGETFSTVKTLGEISTAKGYVAELVIKEDTTKPEVGGGLCQVSTTLFRAALNSGLPIVERHNHKYRVSYYEPPVGMDATIYDPSPDLKFENNTSGYILIQTSISGKELTFEFYGTSDGRKVEISDPVLYDIVSPGEPVYNEDSSLAPGEIVQKEKAHDGSKTTFHYKVTSSSGKILTETDFTSTYTPWRAVYSVGPGGKPEENKENQPESSPSPSPTSSESQTPNP